MFVFVCDMDVFEIKEGIGGGYAYATWVRGLSAKLPQLLLYRVSIVASEWRNGEEIVREMTPSITVYA